MPQIHLLIGPVGAGKSTLAGRLARSENAVHLDLDAWMATLYGDDERPEDDRIGWYMERVARCTEQVWATAEAILATGTSVVLEIGLIQRHARRAFYNRVDAGAWDMTVHVVDAPRDVRRDRVKRRNEDRGPTWSMDVPMAFFELASDLWQAPEDDEIAEREIVGAGRSHRV